MTDFIQNAEIATIHDLGSAGAPGRRVEPWPKRVGLILPVTGADRRAPAFTRIVQELREFPQLDRIVVVLGLASKEEYQRTLRAVSPLGRRADVLWTDGPQVQSIYHSLLHGGVDAMANGKGRAVWSAFGLMLADPELEVFALHDCDIVSYHRSLVSRLCLPLVHPDLHFEYCKAYYARTTDRMYGRVVRLLMTPLLRALMELRGQHPFLRYLSSFRYPLSGEFALSRRLALENRVPSHWGLEVGTLAEVYRTATPQRVCQVDLGIDYEHKHQELDAGSPQQGLLKMAAEIVTTVFRALAAEGISLSSAELEALPALFVDEGHVAVQRYNADAAVNGLRYDRENELAAVEAFAARIAVAAGMFQRSPGGGAVLPCWREMLLRWPDLPRQLEEAVRTDALEGRRHIGVASAGGSTRTIRRPGPRRRALGVTE